MAIITVYVMGYAIDIGSMLTDEYRHLFHEIVSGCLIQEKLGVDVFCFEEVFDGEIAALKCEHSISCTGSAAYFSILIIKCALRCLLVNSPCVNNDSNDLRLRKK